MKFILIETNKNNNKKTTPEKESDTVKTFRLIREKIALEMANMDIEHIQEYSKKNAKL